MFKNKSRSKILVDLALQKMKKGEKSIFLSSGNVVGNEVRRVLFRENEDYLLNKFLTDCHAIKNEQNCRWSNKLCNVSLDKNIEEMLPTANKEESVMECKNFTCNNKDNIVTDCDAINNEQNFNKSTRSSNDNDAIVLLCNDTTNNDNEDLPTSNETVSIVECNNHICNSRPTDDEEIDVINYDADSDCVTIECARHQPYGKYKKYIKTKIDDVLEATKGLSKRRNFCPFCKKLITNFSRHIVLKHSEEEEVKQYMAISDDDSQKKKTKRAILTNSLRKRGNHMFNLEVIEKKRISELLPVKRSNKYQCEINNISHVICKHCSGLFVKENLYKHLKSCSNNSETHESFHHTKKNVILNNHGKLLVPRNSHASDILKNEVYPNMAKDKISVIVQSDSLIVKFGSRFRNTHRGMSQIHYCSSKMRSLASLFLNIKKLNPNVQELKDCIDPKNFDFLVEAVRRMSAFNSTTGDCKTPSLPARLCSSIKSCADILCSEAIKNASLTSLEKKEIICKINDFHHLMRKDWATEISTNCEKSRRQHKVIKEDILPDTEDIRLFSGFLNKLCVSGITQLRRIPNEKTYEDLAKTLIALIITLNRRRPGEVVEITLENYKTIDMNNDYGVLDETALTEEEKNTGKQLSIFYIAANKNKKKVPVLLTQIMKDGIEALMGAREVIGVKSELLFGRPGKTEKFDGSVVMRDLKMKANLKKPNHFTATGLRHHAATSSQLHQRNDTYTKRLAKFLGHDLATHENYYEIPLPLVQKAVVGHQLVQMTRPRRLTEKTKKETSPLHLETSTSNDSDLEISDNHNDVPETPPKKRCKRVRWSVSEKETICRCFCDFFMLNIKPTRKEIKKVWEKEKTLNGRSLEQVIAYVYNIATNKQNIPSPLRIKMKQNYLSS